MNPNSSIQPRLDRDGGLIVQSKVNRIYGTLKAQHESIRPVYLSTVESIEQRPCKPVMILKPDGCILGSYTLYKSCGAYEVQ